MSVDLHIQLRDPSRQRPRAVFTLDPNNAQAVEGLQKLVNRWLKLFLTKKGSHPVRRTEGTIFSNLVGGNIASLRGTEVYIIEAIDDANDQILALDRQNLTAPPEERLGSAALAQFVEVPPAGIEFWVTLRNLSGDTAQVILPYAND